MLLYMKSVRERFVLAVFLAFCVFMIFFYEVYVNERENFNDKKMKRKSLDKKRIKFVIKIKFMLRKT